MEICSHVPPLQLIPTFGGMNIAHGMPDEAWVFWSICGVSLVGGSQTEVTQGHTPLI